VEGDEAVNSALQAARSRTRSALKVLVCFGSFTFTFLFGGAILCAVFAPFVAIASECGQGHFAILLSLVPVILAAIAGLRAARLGLRHERARQENTKAEVHQ
jgi:hypothetical protein